MRTTASAAAIARIESVARDLRVTEVTSQIIHINDGQCKWFARAAEVTAPPTVGECEAERDAYFNWCQSHRGIKESDLSSHTLRRAKELGLTAGGW